MSLTGLLGRLRVVFSGSAGMMVVEEVVAAVVSILVDLC